MYAFSREGSGFGFGIGFCMEGFENSCGIVRPDWYSARAHRCGAGRALLSGLR